MGEVMAAFTGILLLMCIVIRVPNFFRKLVWNHSFYPVLTAILKSATKKTEKNMEKILLLMDYGTEYKTAEIAEKVGLKAPRTRELLNMLAKNGKVEIMGSNQDRRYRKVH